MTTLILASSSQYRRQLLDKLQLNYHCHAPDIDESARPEETASELIRRLSISKALALASINPNCLIIGSDQVAVHAGDIIGKPGDKPTAQQQLLAFSGQRVTFHTGLCLLNTSTQNVQSAIETYQVEFNQLSPTQIDTYLEIEQPYDCAGSFKSEGLGISLFKRLIGDDPNSLVGLPLIRLCEFLRNENLDPLSANARTAT